MRYILLMFSFSIVSACYANDPEPSIDAKVVTDIGFVDIGSQTNYWLDYRTGTYLYGHVGSMEPISFCSEDENCITHPVVVSLTNDLPEEMVYKKTFTAAGFETVGYHDGVCTTALYDRDNGKLLGINDCKIQEDGAVDYLQTYIARIYYKDAEAGAND